MQLEVPCTVKDGHMAPCLWVTHSTMKALPEKPLGLMRPEATSGPAAKALSSQEERVTQAECSGLRVDCFPGLELGDI